MCFMLDTSLTVVAPLIFHFGCYSCIGKSHNWRLAFVGFGVPSFASKHFRILSRVDRFVETIVHPVLGVVGITVPELDIGAVSGIAMA